ncbi:UvrD-helicase domain-containing protein [Candidatus Dependentiae bacterium]|nr:UvrD-helicase domain-containing protein [Candidatus Dependentiae bacterium]
MTPVQSFKSFIETQLNSQQKRAVTAAHGSYLVIAGAGSGKTRVITARITNLILEHNIEPSSIIALTFTNKAAQEMQHRIQHFLPHLRTKPYIATFHAYCLMLLKKNIHLLNKETFTVIDAQDAQKLLTSILKDRGLERLFNAKQLLPMFSTIKLSQLLKAELPEWNMHHMQQFIELYNEYGQQKRLSNYLDFDDLLYTTYKLLSSNEPFKLKHINNHRHILIDEYQDTNTIQHALLKEMSLINNNFAIDSVCAVGDEDQSIYSWRGATVQNILEFDKEFPNTQTIKLEQNYRSTQNILDIANHVIKNNTQRNHKQLWSSNIHNHKPMILECLSDLQEASIITQLITILGKKEKRSDIAILYRTHYQSRVLEEALLKEAVPYKIIGGIQFYERKEIKDMLAYLRLCINPYDRISFFRIINCPLRGLGEKFEEIFLQIWNQNPLSTFLDIIKIIVKQDLVSNKQKISLAQFAQLFENIIIENTAKTLEHFIMETNYITYLIDNHEKKEAEEKRENISEFIRAANHFNEKQNTGLSQFLDEIALMQEQIKKEDNSTDCIQMMTLHAAKGLEFKNVILAGLEEGILPSNQSIGQENVEEERRLFYVGITRAQEKLFITTSKYRNVFGKLDEQRPSRFLQEIPLNLVQCQPATHWSKTGFQTFLQDWVDQKNNHSGVVNFQKNNLHPNKPINETESSCKFKRLQTVSHPTFGLGIAHTIEQKGDKVFITVQFANHGSKKIEGSFLTII